MSATPIPRTLAMSLYGDMDVSSIETRPEGRKPILTKYFEGSSMKPFLKQLKDYLAQGGQCYVICPLIEDNEDLPLKSALTIYEAMSSYFKGHYQTGLLHGSLKDEEKNAVMQDFKDNKIQILVSTTEVEGGVDGPNANMMVIYNAERFGLSSIHQLRGRIGRGNQQGYCFLLSVAQDEPAKERLHYLEEHDDGFEISQYDLKTRGPGELLGDKQSGLPAFMMGDIFKDMNILEETRRYAIKMIHETLIKSYNGDMAARDSMHNAQCLAGMAFSNALLGIVHSMAHKTGAAFEGGHIIHGAANAMYLPKVIKYNAKNEEAAKRYAEIADFIHLGGNTTEEKIDKLIELLRKMNDELNIPHCIKHYGEGGLPAEEGIVPEDEFLKKLPEIAANAILDACTGSNPRQPNQEEMEKLLKCCYYDTEVDF